MSQRFYDQYVKSYLPIIKIRYEEAYLKHDNEEIEKIKEEIFKLKSLKEWQKKGIWDKISLRR